MVDEVTRKVNADLLPHEFTHSWNGKYRRPAGLATPDYAEPMKGGLLWVYEGFTQYLGEVLTPRSGLLTPEEFREDLAITAAALDHEYGAATGGLSKIPRWPRSSCITRATIMRVIGSGVDYYDEGTLIGWKSMFLIRDLSKGAKSLNDFCRHVRRRTGGSPALKTYTFEDIVAGLNAVQPYDWTDFFNQRLEAVGPHAAFWRDRKQRMEGDL